MGVVRDYEVKVEGLRELRTALRRSQTGLDKSLRRSLLAIAQEVRDTARAKAPRRSGKLARSIRATANAKGAAIRTNLVYAPVHEFGGHVGRKHHTPIRESGFMREAVRDSRGVVSERLRGLGDAIADDFSGRV